MLHRTRSRPGMGGVVNLILGGPVCLLWTPAAAITRLERIAAIEEGGLSGALSPPIKTTISADPLSWD